MKTEELEKYWKANPEAKVLLVVGDQVFLPEKKQSAENYARERGLELKEVSKEQQDSADPEQKPAKTSKTSKK